MEAIAQNITASCPSAFAGVSGSLFANAVAAVVAAHCAVFSDLQWPVDKAEQILGRSTGSISYDFIVVGGGTAGSLVASRLSNLHPSWSVLLIEAGGDPDLDNEIPALLFLSHGNDRDWLYKTEPNNESCLSFKNKSCIWNKGKSLGGSSSINAMLYIRGHPDDYNEWENLGNPGWKYNEMIPHFEKIEKKFNLIDSKDHSNPWYEIIESAWKELGFSSNKGDDEAQIGIKKAKLLTDRGKRLNTAKVYLNEAKNLDIMKNTIVQKVIIDADTNTAKGVEILHKSGSVMQIMASKEVILSAGSIATPQILMLSGIGPKPQLEKHNIKSLVNLNVGQNLQDHITVPVLLKANQNITLPSKMITIFLLQYMFTNSGPFSNIGVTDFMGFIDTKNTDNDPNVQFLHTYFPQNYNFMIEPYFTGLGYEDEVVKSIVELNKESDLLGIYPVLLHPKSRGEVILKNADPLSKPVIKSNYFQNRDDMTALVEAMNFIQRLVETDTFRSLGIEIPVIKSLNCPYENYWECYIRNMGTTLYHPVGTAKMGPKEDSTSVVDNNLLVHGLKNLRVVDASVMPVITRGNTMAPTLAIADKAVDIIIAKHYRYKDEL